MDRVHSLDVSSICKNSHGPALLLGGTIDEKKYLANRILRTDACARVKKHYR